MSLIRAKWGIIKNFSKIDPELWVQSLQWALSSCLEEINKTYTTKYHKNISLKFEVNPLTSLGVVVPQNLATFSGLGVVVEKKWI